VRRQLIVNGGILAIALGTLGVVWATRDAPTTAQLSARRGKLLDTWNKDAVTRITLRRDGKQVVLARDASVGVEGDFKILEPWQERADIATVSALLGSLDLASSLRTAPGVDAKQAGLAPATLEIALQMSGKSHVLRLGGPAPAPAGARYLQVQNGSEAAQIVTISAGVVSELDVPLDKLREPRLLSVTQEDIASISIAHDRGKVELYRQKPPPTPAGFTLASTFYVQHGAARELADRDAVLRIMTAFSRLVSSQFVEPEQARGQLASDPGAVHVKLEPIAKSGPPVSFTLGGKCPSDAAQQLALREEARGATRAGCVPAEVVDALRLTEAQLVLDSPFAARFDEVESMTVSSRRTVLLEAHKPYHLTLKRKDTAFRLTAPSDAEVSLEAGNERIQAIVRAPASRPNPPLTDPSLWQDDGWITIHLASEQEERIVLGKLRADGSRCLKRELDQIVLCVDQEAAKAFLPDPTLLRGSTVTSFAAADLKELSIEAGALRERVERQADGSFTLREPEGFGHDGALVTDVVQLLGSLHAERWVAASPEPAHGFEHPRLRARASLSSAPGSHELLVGAATTGGFFARLNEDPGVFVLARSSLETLETPLIDRALCPFEPSELQLIELQRGSRKIGLKQGSDGFETVSALRAEQALHTGPERANEGLRQPVITVTFGAKSGQRRALRVGARDRVAGRSIAYARLDGVDATFALAESSLAALQDF
jgi:hypothetical protein